MTLNIKPGDWAVLRNGEIRGPISIDNDEEKYPLVTSSESWTAKGEWLHENDFTRFGGHVDRDIIATLPCPPLERIRQLEEALRETIELYGNEGGPWNVPSDPGGWISRARRALGESK